MTGWPQSRVGVVLYTLFRKDHQMCVRASVDF